MKKHLFAILLCLCAAGTLWGTSPTGQVKTVVDWPAFLQKQDLTWDVLPEHWYESAFMGNGMLGLMVYKEPEENYIRLETGHCGVHDHRPGTGLFANPRLVEPERATDLLAAQYLEPPGTGGIAGERALQPYGQPAES